MNILIAGNSQNLKELKEKFGIRHNYIWLEEAEEIGGVDLIFDFDLDENPERLEWYESMEDCVLFVNTAKTCLSELVYLHGMPSIPLYGFNGLPTFLNQERLEICSKNGVDDKLKVVFSDLEADYVLVEDRVGMTTPRMIAMMINEAYFSVQEGAATKSDIDSIFSISSDPIGPFELADRIGINHIYEVLDAIYQDTHDSRYRICPLLKREYLELEV